MLNFSIQVDGIQEATRYLNALQRKQIPFATAKALTETASDARDEIVRGLDRKFTLRSMWWKPRTRFGFNIKAAKKTDLEAEVFTRAPWMKLHETGGIKKPAQGKHLAVPSSFVRRNKRNKITTANRPRNLKNSFVGTGKNGQKTIFQRKRKQVIPMYFLERDAQIRERLQFRDTAQRVVNKRWMRNFNKALDHALRTAK